MSNLPRPACLMSAEDIAAEIVAILNEYKVDPRLFGIIQKQHPHQGAQLEILRAAYTFVRDIELFRSKQHTSH